MFDQYSWSEKAMLTPSDAYEYKEFIHYPEYNYCYTQVSTRNIPDRICFFESSLLREYAKQLVKENDIQYLLENIDNEYYEEIMLQGMIIGQAKEKDFEKIKKWIQDFIPKIDNWAVCDTFCAGLKITKKYKDEIWNLLKKYLNSNKEFEIRFAVVMILDYYIEEKKLNEIYKICDKIENDAYYVKMAVAWCISICLVKYYDETLNYLETCKLDDFTYRKAIQKAIESYRLTDEQKEILKTKR